MTEWDSRERPLEDWEYPDDEPEQDSELDDDDLTIVCPECRSEVYEDCAACHVCGHYFNSADRSSTNRPFGSVGVIIIVLLVVALAWIVVSSR